MAKGSTITDTVRTVHACCVEREGDFLRVTVRGDGFLYNMVRIIVGTLIDVAEKRILPQDIPVILERKERVAAGLTAPACGLYLAKVFYPDNLL
jgi:tRNA pseudouridine38-40 synthase